MNDLLPNWGTKLSRIYGQGELPKTLAVRLRSWSQPLKHFWTGYQTCTIAHLESMWVIEVSSRSVCLRRNCLAVSYVVRSSEEDELINARIKQRHTRPNDIGISHVHKYANYHTLHNMALGIQNDWPPRFTKAALWTFGSQPFHNPVTPLCLTILENACAVPRYLKWYIDVSTEYYPI